MFQFYWPWLSFLFFLPWIAHKLPLGLKQKEGSSLPVVYFPSLERLKSAFSPSSFTSNKPSSFSFIFLYLSWCFLTIALMQPEIVHQFKQIKNEGYDLLLAVDISASMQSLDFSTKTETRNRLDVTKEVVGKFVEERKGDRVGLVVFGESAYVHVPLTLDTLAVSKMLNMTVPGMAGNGTAIGDAIGLSVQTFRERPLGSRVLVLLTDGEDNSSKIPPLQAAKLAKQYGIRIYTIGVGKKGRVPFPNGFGGYTMVEVSIDEDLLKEIASLTDGQYFRATDQQALESIYEKINQLEKTESEESLFLIRDPLYPYFLGLALFFLVLLSLHEIFYRRTAHGF